jgi:hypothetical protein
VFSTNSNSFEKKKAKTKTKAKNAAGRFCGGYLRFHGAEDLCNRHDLS